MAEVAGFRMDTPYAQALVSGMFRIRALCSIADSRATSSGVPFPYSGIPGLSARDL